MTPVLKKRFLVIAAVIVGSIASMLPLDKRINLGLDLKGGMHVILRVENDALPTPQAKDDAVLRSIEVVRNRIDNLGVGETLIQRQGENQILVQLPGMTDRAKAKQMWDKVAHLEFRLVERDAEKLKAAIGGQVPEGYELMKTKGDIGAPVLVAKAVAMNGDAIKDARMDFDSQTMLPEISLTFNDKGAKDFSDLTSAHVGEELAIILDNEVLSSPNIREPIMDGKARISGSFTSEEASMLALSLRSGALPVPMKVEEERTIGPLLGKDSIEAGVKATILGGILIIVFMSAYYLLGGFIASLALFVNLLMIVGSMGLINILMPDSQVTLTLPGIAGIILTLGMAVDANVLINERIREELDNGRPLGAAINIGYSRAWSAIFDSHVTSFIAGAILFWFGSGPIKGFAVTLTTGLLASLFTSIYITRTMFIVAQEVAKIKNLKMFHIFKNPNFNFLNKQYICAAISISLIIWGAVTLNAKKDTAYGIDFSGGQIQELKFSKPVAIDQIREIFNKENLGSLVIQGFVNAPENLMIRSNEDVHDQVAAVLQKHLPDNKYEMLRVEKVGPVVGQELRNKAVIALVLSLLGILIYVGFRFKHYDFAAASVIAIFHDVLITLGLIVIMGRQIDLLVVTALLTVAGYSMNDSIVIYDRVRENVVKEKNKPLSQIINESINQTLGRSILTTFVTGLSVLALFFVGGEVLNTFALVLMLGFIFGTYSTVYVVSPLFLLFHGNKKW